GRAQPSRSGGRRERRAGAQRRRAMACGYRPGVPCRRIGERAGGSEMRLSLSALIVLAGLGAAMPAHAHKPSDSYLTLKVDGQKIDGQWDIALRDLDFAIGLDANQAGNITYGEVRAKQNEIAAYALSRLRLASSGTSCPAGAVAHLIDNHSDGAYVVLRFAASCASEPTAVRVSYRLFFDLDPQHRGLLQLSRQ